MLTVTDSEGRSQARAVITEALAGSLSIEDFHRDWPDSLDPLLKVIFEETEDTVEHSPGSLFRPGSVDEQFRKSVPYKILLVDGELLSEEFIQASSQRMVGIRERLLKELDLAQDDSSLRNAAREFVTRALSAPA